MSTSAFKVHSQINLFCHTAINFRLLFGNYNVGGRLATINSVREQDFLANFPRVYPEDDFLIGLNRRADFKEFVWSNATFYSYSAWAKDQPTGGKFDECTALSKEMNGRWVSVDCSDMRSYVCEYQRGKSIQFKFSFIYFTALK